MLEKWKSAVDNKRNFGALLTDLSKAFDSLRHDLLLAKLNAYGFSLPALRLVQSCLSNRKQRTKIKKFCLGYLKDQFWDLFYLISFYVIHFS